MNQTKEEWKEAVLDYIGKKKGQNVSIFEICSFYGLVPKNLKDAVEELERDMEIGIVLDEEGKKWLREKD